MAIEKYTYRPLPMMERFRREEENFRRGVIQARRDAIAEKITMLVCVLAMAAGLAAKGCRSAGFNMNKLAAPAVENDGNEGEERRPLLPMGMEIDYLGPEDSCCRSCSPDPVLNLGGIPPCETSDGEIKPLSPVAPPEDSVPDPEPKKEKSPPSKHDDSGEDSVFEPNEEVPV